MHPTLRYWLTFVAIPLAGCSFSGDTESMGVDKDAQNADAVPADATLIDADPADATNACTPNETVCANKTLRTCGSDGLGFDVSLEQDCSFSCTPEGCLLPSNIFDVACATEVALTPPAGATVTFGGASPAITCAPHCGDGTTTAIAATATLSPIDAPDLAVFCLSELSVPADVTIGYLGTADFAVALSVSSTAEIAGEIDLSGNEEFGGPGGSNGGALSAAAGSSGFGLCVGTGGGRAGGSGDSRAAAGGGGGGFTGPGGSGGDGQALSNGAIATGGNSANGCGSDNLIPLTSGSGGGSGADANCTGSCGWPGGGSGGGLQISAATSITITAGGALTASGSDGVGDASQSGGGGGGSGGAILLEAPTLSILGDITVNGGDGGTAGAGPGGIGANAAQTDGTVGTSQTDVGEGGSGGGGGRGIVRLNAQATPTCTNVSPAVACTAGLMTGQ